MSDDLLKLAERCEAASGPDRELDRDIELAFPYEDAKHLQFGLPQYTGSIDWAKTLVPVGCAWILYSDGPTYIASAEIGLHPSGGQLMQAQWSGAGEAPALALTAAALRARSAA